MLRGADDIIRHVKQRLGISHKGSTADGMFSFEEVECIGACSWAPAMQVNYDFHEKLTAERVDEILDQYRSKSSL
jgi:NADH-quinone oxidoreductase subunit E